MNNKEQIQYLIEKLLLDIRILIIQIWNIKWGLYSYKVRYMYFNYNKFVYVFTTNFKLTGFLGYPAFLIKYSNY